MGFQKGQYPYQSWIVFWTINQLLYFIERRLNHLLLFNFYQLIWKHKFLTYMMIVCSWCKTCLRSKPRTKIHDSQRYSILQINFINKFSIGRKIIWKKLIFKECFTTGYEIDYPAFELFPLLCDFFKGIIFWFWHVCQFYHIYIKFGAENR